MNELRIENATIVKSGAALFQPVQIHARAGAPVLITGPSGVGKSSLLAWIAGVLPPGLTGQGDISLNNVPMNATPAHRRRIGIMFQDDLLFPHLSIAENLAFGMRKGEPRAQIGEALRIAGLEGAEDRDPRTLSGGERARISLMRCLLSRPLALLLDEPFSKLDPSLWERMRSFVLDQARELPILLVSHDPRDMERSENIVSLRPAQVTPKLLGF